VLWRPAAAAGGPRGAAGSVAAGPAAAGPASAGAASGRAASGGVGAGLELAIVHRPRYDDWSLPKGKLSAGEHPLLAACREVQEETGVNPVAGRRLPPQEYRLGPDRKTVDYWAMTPRAGAATAFTANDEVDQVRWVRPAEAVTWLSYDRDRELVRAFLAVSPASTMLLLVRHARAGERASWSGDDRLRPLDALGRAQAQTLRRSLRCFWPDRVLAADNLRCLDTVRPLAEDLQVPVEAEPALTEQAFTADPKRALRRIRELVALRGRSVLCSQGGVIPDIIHAVGQQSRLALPEVPARKSSVWALSFVDDRLVAADYYPDLAEVTNMAGPGGQTQ
jgi:8-oxo-dGTP diphosphatase